MSAEAAAEFWDRVLALVQEYGQLPRSGETVFALVAGLYPNDYPALEDGPDESV